MSLSTIDLVQTTTRHGRPGAHAPAPRRRLRNARRALALVPGSSSTTTMPAPRDHGVRLHPVELGPWDD